MLADYVFCTIVGLKGTVYMIKPKRRIVLELYIKTNSKQTIEMEVRRANDGNTYHSLDK
jgi:hypothetical protein